MNNYALSVIRHVVQVAVGSLVAWLLSLGIDVGAEANTGLTIFLTAVVVGLYYILVRAVEKHLPAWLRTILMGASKVPVYTPANKEFEVRTVAPSRRGYDSL